MSALGAYFRLVIVVVVVAMMTLNAVKVSSLIAPASLVILAFTFGMISFTYIKKRLQSGAEIRLKAIFSANVLVVAAALLVAAGRPWFAGESFKAMIGVLLAASIMTSVPLMVAAAKYGSD